MPSSGYPMEDLIGTWTEEEGHVTTPETLKTGNYISDCIKQATKYGLEVEWLESFVGAWNQTHDIYIACNAGIEEWDL
jgi:hypothetical protein